MSEPILKGRYGIIGCQNMLLTIEGRIVIGKEGMSEPK